MPKPSTTSRHTATARRRSAALPVLVALACAALLNACAGGSGSSGFDPLASENAAIDRALDSGACQMEDGLTICASGGTAAPTPPPASATPTATLSSGPIDHPTATTTRASVTGTATPTQTPGGAPTASGTPPRDTATPTSTPTWTPIPAQPNVDTNIAAGDVVFCQPSGPGQPCVLSFGFLPSGLPDTAAYRVAVRTRNADSDWHIVPLADHGALIDLDPNGPDIQIAVLVFLEGPGVVPDQLELLADSGADYAFLTPVLMPEALGARR